MNEFETEQRLVQQRDVAVPVSTAPSVQSLQQKVDRIRNRRKIARTAVGVAAVLIGAAGTFFAMSRSDDRVTPQPTVIAVANDATADQENTHVESAVTQTSKQTPTSVKPKIQLYARVRGAVPVFDFDADKKIIQHVGWTESEQKIPVDMRYVPKNQQETFNAVLSGDNADDWRLSL